MGVLLVLAMLALTITALLLMQTATPAAPPTKRVFEDRFLAFSQAVLVAGATSKIIAKYSRDVSKTGQSVATSASIAGSVITIEALAYRRMNTPTKYLVGTGNIVAGVILGLFAHHDTQYTRAVLTGQPPPTY